jgi:hypothetical protein
MTVAGLDDSLDRLGIRWGAPVRLETAVRGQDVPSMPGLYRIRRVGLRWWDYIGQTGTGQMTLHKRMAMLRGVYLPDMPYRDPHTAGPGLWALRQSGTQPFEAEFCPVEGTTPWRKGLEAVSIAVHRQEHGKSPTLNFGRMPAGFRMSSGNNARLVAAGRRFRGGPDETVTESHEPGVPPIGRLEGDSTSGSWCGHAWACWMSMGTKATQTLDSQDGLYRIRGSDERLVYIGEGAIRSRLLAHLAKLNASAPQGQALRAATPLSFSAVANSSWRRHQRLELETDLIGAYVLANHEPPAAQFIG